MIATKFRREACGETYDDVSKLMNQLCYSHLRGCPMCDRDELFAAAEDAFLRVYDRWVPRRSAFITPLYRAVQRAIWRHCNTQRRRAKHYSPVDPDRLRRRQTSGVSNVERIRMMAEDLSDDARQVVIMVMEAPEDMLVMFNETKDKRDLLRGYLRGFGWSMLRITETFSEISEAMAL